jgi:hypothetical protein
VAAVFDRVGTNVQFGCGHHVVRPGRQEDLERLTKPRRFKIIIGKRAQDE